MTLVEHFLDELRRETERTRHALEAVPEGHDDWKPHEKSMPFGRLANLCAMMPGWFALVIKQDELDLTPAPGHGQFQQPPARTPADLVALLNKSASDGQAALTGTSDDFLLTTKWRLKAGGQVAMEQLRYIVLRETFTHLAHHRGQLTVYLRLLGAKVPSIYGPSADDTRFA